MIVFCSKDGNLKLHQVCKEMEKEVLLQSWKYIKYAIKWKRSLAPNLHVVDMDTFGNPILAVEDFTTKDLDGNAECAIITDVLPFVKACPNKFTSPIDDNE